jgi:hypothetical protein
VIFLRGESWAQRSASALFEGDPKALLQTFRLTSRNVVCLKPAPAC